MSLDEAACPLRSDRVIRSGGRGTYRGTRPSRPGKSRNGNAVSENERVTLRCLYDGRCAPATSRSCVIACSPRSDRRPRLPASRSCIRQHIARCGKHVHPASRPAWRAPSWILWDDQRPHRTNMPTCHTSTDRQITHAAPTSLRSPASSPPVAPASPPMPPWLPPARPPAAPAARHRSPPRLA